MSSFSHRLIPQLFENCRDDAVKYCNAKSKWNEVSMGASNDPTVLPCLFHHIHESEDEDGVKTEAKVKNYFNVIGVSYFRMIF